MSHQESRTSLVPLPPDLEQKVLDQLPAGVVTTLYSFPQLFIAGGFIRACADGGEPKDVDIFTTDLAVVERAVEFYARQCERWGQAVKESTTPCTITVTGEKLPVQFVNNVAYATREQCLAEFDFTVCQAAFGHVDDRWGGICTPEFLRDVAKKRLVYTTPNRVEAPGGSLWRACKFLTKGYAITQEELAKLVQRLMRGIVREKDEPCHDAYWLEEAQEAAKPDYPTPGIDTIRRSFNMGGPTGTY